MHEYARLLKVYNYIKVYLNLSCFNTSSIILLSVEIRGV